MNQFALLVHGFHVNSFNVFSQRENGFDCSSTEFALIIFDFRMRIDMVLEVPFRCVHSTNVTDFCFRLSAGRCFQAQMLVEHMTEDALPRQQC